MCHILKFLKLSINSKLLFSKVLNSNSNSNKEKLILTTVNNGQLTKRNNYIKLLKMNYSIIFKKKDKKYFATK